MLVDQRRETCVRCERSNYMCHWFKPPAIFIFHNPATREVSLSASSSSFTDERNASPSFKNRWASRPSLGVTLPLNAFKDNIVISHLLERLSLHLPRCTGDALPMDAVFEKQNLSSNGYISGLCLAEALFANVQKDSRMVTSSLATYSVALRNLRKDLNLVGQGNRLQGYLNLWSCVFLVLREMVSPSSATDWMQHSRGMGILVS